MVERGTEEGGGKESSPWPLIEAPRNIVTIPPPLAKYEDVKANRELFMDTLEKLHATVGTKFMIPIIGGKELDLHRLFVETTSRGGIEKIIRERKWKEVTAVFNFPSTATNASFVLRKYYLSLLKQFEQIYYFGAQAPLQSPSSAPVPSQGLVEPMLPSPEVQTAVTHKRRKSKLSKGSNYCRGSNYCSLSPLVAVSPPSSKGTPVVGVIDGKFGYGYLVTVTVGTEKLKGVLYHTPENPACDGPQYPDVVSNQSVIDPATSNVRRRRRRKKSEMRKRDPAHPKPNRSGYNFFFAEQHARLKPLHPGKDREISKMIGYLWNRLTENDKAVYQEQGMKDRERYRSEMEEYRERLRKGQIISNVMPIQQRLAAPEVTVMEADVKIGSGEGDSQQTRENDCGESDSDDEKTVDNGLEMETSPGAGNGAASINVAAEMQCDAPELILVKSYAKIGSGGDSPQTRGKDSTGESDFENENTVGKDVEMETSKEAENGAESTNVDAEMQHDAPEISMVEVDAKLGSGEEEYPQTQKNYSTGETDAEDQKTADKDLELDPSPEAVKGAESTNVVAEASAERGF
ncbi:hypothetical protein HHK36_027087 [Tetracentron sinense]|uniref:Uncharacterized protein n=1 Tax=Tetracentron sinense TaxID=13715 RepID=A0A834YKM3_TETSI|nr:hypothetical protein HHK36_027087 [Tetracentron sinense]